MGTSSSKVLIVYFPYDMGLERDLATPVPDYHGWPVDRIEKDFMRFQDMGVDGVLVGVPIDGLVGTTRPDQYKKFLDLLAQNQDWPSVAFYVYVNEDLDEDSERFFTSWIVDSLVSRPAKYITLGGRPLVVFGPCLQWRFRHPALTVRLSSPGFSEWPSDNSDGLSGMDSPFENVWIRPTSEVLDRVSDRGLRRIRDSFEFEKRLRSLLNSGQSDFITIYSWNDFSNGTFIEPNSLDEYDMSRAVYRALHR